MHGEIRREDVSEIDLGGAAHRRMMPAGPHVVRRPCLPRTLWGTALARPRRRCGPSRWSPRMRVRQPASGQCDAAAVGSFAQLPAFAAWRFVGLVDGFEVVYITRGRLRGHTSAVEDRQPYAVRYEIAFDERWRTREARVASDTLAGSRETVLAADGQGTWTVDGLPAPHLDGVIDVDLEASACTNMLPVHRLALAPGEVVAAPAAYVQALDLTTRRLHQTYRRREDGRFDYTSEDFEAVLSYDASGLIVDYPGIATRFA